MIKIGLDPTWAVLGENLPFGAIKGFSVELTEEIAKQQGLKISIYDKNWDNLLPSLEIQDVDGILTKMEPKIFYEKKYAFSNLYLPTGPVLVVPLTSKKPSSFAGKEIAILDSNEESLVTKRCPEAILRLYSSTSQALADIAFGVIDGAVIDILTATAFCTDLYHGILTVELPPLNQEGLRLITLQNHSSSLMHSFNKGLQTLKDNGTYDKLAKKWNVLTD